MGTRFTTLTSANRSPTQHQTRCLPSAMYSEIRDSGESDTSAVSLNYCSHCLHPFQCLMISSLTWTHVQAGSDPMSSPPLNGRISFLTVEYLSSLSKSFLLRNSTGLSSYAFPWTSTAPSPTSDASTCTINLLEKSGLCKTASRHYKKLFKRIRLLHTHWANRI